MFATYFEWDIRDGREEDFRQAWADVTRRLHSRGSLGSALFRNEKGHFCAFARWPDREARDAAFAMDETPQADTLAMRECIAATIHRIDMDEVQNLWLDEAHDRGGGRSG